MRSKDHLLLEEAYQTIILKNIEEKYNFQKTKSHNGAEDTDESEKKENVHSNKTIKKGIYAKKGKYVTKKVKSENFVHGIQPIVEAKKKVNPWAIEKSIEKKTGKKFGKKHKEEIIKGIKKSAKKTGKEITSDKVNSKKK